MTTNARLQGRPSACARRVLGSLAVMAIGVLAAAPARAADVLELTWNAPAGCPSGAEVKAAALRGAEQTEAIVAIANVEQTGPTAWRVRLAIRDRERDIEGTTCAGVADATAVVLALALMPLQTIEAPAVVPAAAPVVAAPIPTHRVAVGLAGAGALGVLPGAALGGAVSGAWTPARFRVEAEAALFGAQSEHVASMAAGARFHVTSLGGRGCYAVLKSAHADLAPCAGGGVNLVAADGFGADTNIDARSAWVWLTAGALGRVLLTDWLALRGRIEADLPLARPRFFVEGQGLVFRPPTIGAGAFVGAEVLFL